MNIKDIKIEEITPYSKNNKKHPEEQILKIIKSIEKYGFRQPLVLDKENIIVVGHGRYEAGKRMGMTYIPCIIASDLTEDEIREYRIMDNRTNESEWDLENLKLELIDLPDLALEFEDLFQIEEEEGGESEKYTKKIEAPVYEPKNEKPKIKELYDIKKTKELIEAIKNSDLPKEEKEFLTFSAYRHSVFNYKKIADYYAHSNKDIQDLMEKSALVIIDFEKALENGYVKLSEELLQQYKQEKDDEK